MAYMGQQLRNGATREYGLPPNQEVIICGNCGYKNPAGLLDSYSKSGSFFTRSTYHCKMCHVICKEDI